VQFIKKCGNQKKKTQPNSNKIFRKEILYSMDRSKKNRKTQQIISNFCNFFAVFQKGGSIKKAVVARLFCLLFC